MTPWGLCKVAPILETWRSALIAKARAARAELGLWQGRCCGLVVRPRLSTGVITAAHQWA